MKVIQPKFLTYEQIFINLLLFILSTVLLANSLNNKAKVDHQSKVTSESYNVPIKLDLNHIKISNLDNNTKSKTLINEVIGYYWALYSDGCYHLGVVTLNSNGEYWWFPLGYWNYIGQTVRCMNTSEYEVLC